MTSDLISAFVTVSKLKPSDFLNESYRCGESAYFSKRLTSKRSNKAYTEALHFTEQSINNPSSYLNRRFELRKRLRNKLNKH